MQETIDQRAARRNPRYWGGCAPLAGLDIADGLVPRRHGQAHLRKVQIDRCNGVNVEELGGLEDGDPVLVGPSDRIAEGVCVIAR